MVIIIRLLNYLDFKSKVNSYDATPLDLNANIAIYYFCWCLTALINHQQVHLFGLKYNRNFTLVLQAKHVEFQEMGGMLTKKKKLNFCGLTLSSLNQHFWDQIYGTTKPYHMTMSSRYILYDTNFMLKPP